EECKRAGLRSLAALPLRSGADIIGVLGMATRRERDFAAQATFLETIASQVAFGLRNALLYDQIERHAAGLEQRVAERTAELAAKNKELETFAYSVSHDLKAPLRGIYGYSSLLLRDYADRLDDEGKSFLVNIRTAAMRMERLIEDLLAYSRLERRPITIGATAILPLVHLVIAERAADIEQRGVQLTVDVPQTTVRAEPEGLMQALRNLLDNALKFTRDAKPPIIEIGGRETETSCILWVRDNGLGFDMKYHDRLFEIFQRLHRLEEYDGTGIGLAIVRKAMERMGGRVWAESAPGQGATFFLELPK
ncbi:MAG: ATP-binding protein, partial [Anaerolineae bacterium]|nr:ATP-binding protein [Anaerolineae bacterium]